ncbi:decarboxylating 6-phosphogluconate dehydrogenase [Staphylococcus simiae]|uniref:phosphogluconate dehydrogenase (NAD(+)-dependent, decarboxylating) n=1 Tax=Staphylococcus simiae TaxID=308354 RepID=UPI001A97A243|nr:decarboxylating 6-phosphogluconate dehydrogenase [Staphylococcus simiae]MBO1198426.1 decarboxylating 6-phosphogluconate dehydrogenase [Staphylococcus simiae]MBO1200620.1 decarboxylating 6-phosphogluconate dehydrogenase [Staphylococcus simiae]MBO1202891.1 decarboxylating 6-phosphogluconate dehydrogenase [Staphylococcus simiae]MBO1210417.1 decarboxylating 6-phosphogluconate dehydrogenase [Staphylococcus simiae]MBO1228957.1 decarboxylating 6-phosphogluconate dehydrogenase [Staphylococcus simia
MQVGIIGLGKMGFNLALNMQSNDIDVRAFDINSNLRKEAHEHNISTYTSLEKLIESLEKPRKVWLMVPAGKITQNVIESLISLLDKDDIILDGGNAHYKDSIDRYEILKERSIEFLDVGTSGGMEGAKNGVCTMVGGEPEVFSKVENLFEKISVENGFLYTGKPGSGHFLKMVHNGIEYGMMQAIGEGYEILNKSRFEYDYEKVSKVWNNGSVIRSWLIELMQDAFSKDSQLDNIQGVMHSSGEGQWTAETALELKVAAPIITMSQMMRDRSLENDTFSGKIVAALRNEFGGHEPEYK